MRIKMIRAIRTKKLQDKFEKETEGIDVKFCFSFGENRVGIVYEEKKGKGDKQ